MAPARHPLEAERNPQRRWILRRSLGLCAHAVEMGFIRPHNLAQIAVSNEPGTPLDTLVAQSHLAQSRSPLDLSTSATSRGAHLLGRITATKLSALSSR